MRRLNLVHVCPFFDPATRYGGPVAQLRTICGALAERGHVVRVVTSDLGVGPDVRREWWCEREGYRVWYSRSGSFGHTAPYFAPRARGALERAIERAAVVHLHMSFTHLNVLARRVALARNVPYVYAPRTGFDPLRLRERRIAKQAFIALFERRLVRDAACLHAICEAEREQLLRRGAEPERIVVVPNAAPATLRAPAADGDRFRRLLGIPRDATVVLYLGRLERIKGLDLLVEGFASALARAPRGRHDAHLVVAGPDDGERARIEAIARRRGVAATVHFTGHLDGEMHRGALVAADVLALTSRSEGLSNSVLEALGAGRCVLVTEACRLPEVATAGAGVVVRAEIDDVAAGLVHLLGNRVLRSEMGRRGARLVRERFSIDGVIDSLEAMYERAASSGASSRLRQTSSQAA